MTAVLDGYVTGIETSGLAVLPATWSGKLLARLAGMDSGHPNFRAVREAYDGLPMRVAEGVGGEHIFSKARVGVPADWHRCRADTITSGAPAAFIPGICIAGPLTEAGVRLCVVPGSARLRADAAPQAELAVYADLAAGDVAMLDSRCLRRWSRPEAVFELSVVRPWIEPEQDALSLITPETPPRAARFAGLLSAPAAALETWLFERHEKRS